MGSKKGFTLIELMMVITIIGILAAIAAVRFNDTLRKAKEGATKGNLGAIRSALSIYYSDSMAFPAGLDALTANSRNLRSIPETTLQGYHNDSTAIEYLAAASEVGDTGGWSYVNAPSDSNFGRLFVNCTHTDSIGASWSSY